MLQTAKWEKKIRGQSGGPFISSQNFLESAIEHVACSPLCSTFDIHKLISPWKKSQELHSMFHQAIGQYRKKEMIENREIKMKWSCYCEKGNKADLKIGGRFVLFCLDYESIKGGLLKIKNFVQKRQLCNKIHVQINSLKNLKDTLIFCSNVTVHLHTRWFWGIMHVF